MFQRVFALSVGFIFLSLSAPTWALPFNIVPNGALPTSVNQNSTVAASYVITNNTASQRNNSYVAYLPPNVSIAAGGCGSTFSLGAGQSCNLNLTVSGAVNANDPDPHHHLFVCLPGGKVCAGTNYPLNVTVNPNPPANLAITPITSQTTLPYQGIGVATYIVTNNQTSSVTISSKNPAYQTTSTNPSGLTVLTQTDTCAANTILAPNDSCQFSVKIANQTSSFALTPQVCINQDQSCASATNGSFNVTVEPAPLHIPYMYVGINYGDEVDHFVSVNPVTAAVVNNSLGVTFSSGGFAQGIAVSLDGTHAYAASSHTNSVAVIDTSTSTPSLLHTFSTGDTIPIDLAVTPNDAYVYVTGNNGTITCYNVAHNTTTTAATVSGGSFLGVRITSDGSKLVLADNAHDQVLVYTINSDGSLTPAFYSPISISAVIDGVNVSPDSSTAYISGFDGHLYVVSLIIGALTESVTGLSGGSTVTVSKDGLTVYTGGRTNIGVFNTASNTGGSPISTGGGSFGVMVDPTQTYLLTSGNGNNVNIITLADNTVRTVAVGGTQNTVGDFVG